MFRNTPDAMSMSEHPQPRGQATHALFSGGGSGGHVFPGLAVADELGRRGWRVSWAGSPRGLEARLVSERGLPFHPLSARPLVGQGPVAKMRSGLTLLGSAWRARSLVRRLDATVVVGTGGYVSAPAVFGAWLASRPVLLMEPNAEVGFANRWLSRLSSEAVVAHEITRSQLACPSRVAGVPVRQDFFAVGPLPTAPPFRLLVLGGSQGARQINQLLPPALAHLARNGLAIEVLHQTGEHHLDETRDAYRDAGAEQSLAHLDIVPFLDDVAGAMGRSHLVVSRAGAITLAEICAAGRPGLLLPLTLAAAHQVGNARRLAEAGAAEMLTGDTTAPDLTQLLAELLADPERLQAMAENARALGRPRAAAIIADRVEALGRDGAEGGAG